MTSCYGRKGDGIICHYSHSIQHNAHKILWFDSIFHSLLIDYEKTAQLWNQFPIQFIHQRSFIFIHQKRTYTVYIMCYDGTAGEIETSKKATAVQSQFKRIHFSNLHIIRVQRENKKYSMHEQIYFAERFSLLLSIGHFSRGSYVCTRSYMYSLNDGRIKKTTRKKAEHIIQAATLRMRKNALCCLVGGLMNGGWDTHHIVQHSV